MSQSRASLELLADERRLRCRAGVVVRVQPDGRCDVTTPRGRTSLAAPALAMLGVFASGRTPREALEILEPGLTSRRGALDLLDTLVQLVDAGAVVPEEAERTWSSDEERDGFSALPIHVTMLDDRVRTGAWLEAVRHTTQPGEVVVDVGTGTGVLAIAAAQAGARRVYAIEAGAAAETARLMARANAVEDRVHLVRGWSTNVELPERAHVIVTETLGDDPFREGVLETMVDAMTRFALPNARLIPRRIRLFATLVELDERELARHAVTESSSVRWLSEYGMSFAPLCTTASAGVLTALKRDRAKLVKRLSPSVCLADVKLGLEPTHLDVATEIEATDSGACNGVLAHFEAELTDVLRVSTDPWAPDGATHWLNPVLVLPLGSTTRPGTKLRMRYRYPATPSLELVD